MEKLFWTLKKLPISSLKEYERNPRKITRKGLSDLKISIEKFNVVQPIAVNSDGTIIGGHGRKKALTSLKIKEVDCYIPNRELTSDEFKELNIRLNKNIAGEFDMDILAIDFAPDKLIEYGFDKEELKFPDLNEEEKPGEEKEAGLEQTIQCPECGHQFYND